VLDGGQELQRQQRLIVCGPTGLVSIANLLTAHRAVLTVEHHDDLGGSTGYIVADRHPQQRGAASASNPLIEAVPVRDPGYQGCGRRSAVPPSIAPASSMASRPGSVMALSAARARSTEVTI
jgi:hypothetical protein